MNLILHAITLPGAGTSEDTSQIAGFVISVETVDFDLYL